MAEDTNLINVVNPAGKLVAISPEELPDALNQNYRQATPQDEAEYKRIQKYESAGQQAASFAEGVASGATFGLSKPISHALGITTPEATLAREEINPGVEMLGEAGSLLIPGIGPQKLLTKAGRAAGEAVGLGAEAAGAKAIQSAVKAGASKEAARLAEEAALKSFTPVQKIGSQAVAAASENAIFQAGHELGHAATLFSAHPDTDPGEAAQTALTNIGLATILGGGLGGGIGAVNPLWKAVSGAKVNEFLSSVAKKAAGIDGEVPGVLAKEIKEAGLDIPPEIAAGISGDPFLGAMYQTLKESSGKRGVATQESLQQFRNKASESVLESFGKKPGEVLSKSDISDFQVGKNVGDILHKELDSRVGPISKQFETLREKYKNVELPKGEVVAAVPEQFNVYGIKTSNAVPESVLPSFTDQLGDRVLGMADQEGWNTLADSEIMTTVNKVTKSLPKLKTLEDLKKFIQRVGDETYKPTDPALMRAGAKIKEVLRDAESELILQKLGTEGPEVVSMYRGAQEAWKGAARLKDALNERLHVGGGDSIGSFLKNLKAMASTDGESVIRRLSGKNDASVLELLQKEFPGTAEAIKKYHLDDVLGRALDKAAPGESINVKKLVESIDKMSPELRAFAIDQAAHGRATSIEAIIEAASKKMDKVGVAKTLDGLWSTIPATATGLISGVASGNPLIGGAIGVLTKYLGRDAPDAIRLGLLKFLGSNQRIEAEGFKSMVDFIQNTMKGENLIGKTTKDVFRAGRTVLPQALMPDDKSRKRLDKQLASLRDNPEPLFNIGGKTGHYLPDHMGALAQTAASVLNQLNSMRPAPTKMSPLDADPEIPKSKKQEWDRTLDIAEQPLVVLNDIKEGTLTTQDVVLVKTLYPALYKRLSNQLQEQMVETLERGDTIPYSTRMGLSLFVGQPLDTTMTPQSIQATQMAQSMPQGPGQMAPAKKSMTALNKLAPMYATRGQAAEANKIAK